LKKLIISAILVIVCTGSILSGSFLDSSPAENDSAIFAIPKELLAVIKDKD